MVEPLRCELVSWRQVEQLVARLVTGIREADFHPDIVIAIARGGYVPARLVCDHLDIFNLSSIRIVHYQAGADMLDKARLSMPLAVDVRDLNVLVVDDVSDTGDTLQLALEHIHTFHPATLKLAVLHHKQISTVKPDFYGQKVIKWRWLTYPWAIYEDVGQFLAGMEPVPETVAVARQRLQQDHGLKVPERVIQVILTTQGVIKG